MIGSGRRRFRWGAMASLQAAAMVALLSGLAGAPPTAAQAPAAIAVAAKTVDSFDPAHPELVRFRALDFRGGLELSSSTPTFGGLSALRVAADGENFVSVTDRGHWVTGRIVYRGGRPAGLADVRIAPILGPDGRPITTRGWYDSEAIAQDGGTVYVALERVNRILRFDFGASGVLARGQPIAVPPGVGKLPNNKGLEGLVAVPRGLAIQDSGARSNAKPVPTPDQVRGGFIAERSLAGTLIAFSERGLDRADNIRGFLIGGPRPGEFSIRRRDEFDISDAALLPSGDLVLLERKFSWTSGVAMRLRRLALVDLAPGATVDGTVLLTADMGFQIDNMEGISAHRNADGDTILTLVSDDNFSLLQRTLLLQFRLVED